MIRKDDCHQVVGVVSGIGCATPRLPGLYMRVNNYLQLDLFHRSQLTKLFKHTVIFHSVELDIYYIHTRRQRRNGNKQGRDR